jgi:hypothetical protein
MEKRRQRTAAPPASSRPPRPCEAGNPDEPTPPGHRAPATPARRGPAAAQTLSRLHGVRKAQETNPPRRRALVGGRLRRQVRCLPPPSPGSPTAVCALQHHAVPSRWLPRHRKPSTAPRWSGAGRQGCRPSGATPRVPAAQPGGARAGERTRGAPPGSRRARAISRGGGGPVLGDGGRQLRRGRAGRRMLGGPADSPWRYWLSSRSIRPPRPGPRCVRTRPS